MVRQRTFQGARLAFLLEEKVTYATGVDGGYAADALADIQRRYFKRFPVSLAHNEEPSEAHLAAVDDDAPDEDFPAPNEEVLTTEEYAAAVKELEKCTKTVIFRKAQIKRWLAYQYMKDHDIDPKESGAHNPYAILLQKLTQTGMKMPRQRSAMNTWRPSQHSAIEEEVKRRVIEEGTVKRHVAALRESVANKMFSELDKEERDQWAAQAKEEHESAKAKYKEDLAARPSTLPVDRQRCIEGFVRFMQPIADLAAEALGWKVTVIAGGPEPAHDGRLNVISIHSGTTNGDVKMTFGRAERARYKKYIVPIFGSFLQKCYTPEECRLRALSQEDGFEPLQSQSLEDHTVNFDSVEFRVNSPIERPSTEPSVHASITTPGAAASGVSTPPDGACTNPLVLPSNVPTTMMPPSTTPNAATQPSIPSTTTTSASTEALSSAPASHATVSSPSLAAVAGDSLPQIPVAPPRPSPRPSPHPSPHPSPRPSPPPSRAPSLLLSAPNGSEEHGHVTTSAGRGFEVVKKRKNHPKSVDGLEGAMVGVQSTDPRPEAGPGNGRACRSKTKEGPNTGTLTTAPTTASSNLAGGVEVPFAPAQGKRKRKTMAVSSSRDSVAIDAADEPSQVSKRHRASEMATEEDGSSKAPIAAGKGAAKQSKTSDRTRKSSRNTQPTTTVATPLPSLAKVVASSSAPDWFVSTLGMLQSEYSDKAWTQLIRTWMAFEEQEGYAEIEYLGTDSRPDAVKGWISRARTPKWHPDLGNIDKYEKKFNTWWASLQPDWRMSEGGELQRGSVGDDWEDLRRPGLNGVQSIMVALFYWGIKVHNDSSKRVPWVAAVEDCTYSFNSLLNTSI